jgi:serine/threonine protein kinase
MGSGGNTAAAPLVGGRYELEALLGKGGMGEVWRARHVTLDSHVAIKFLHGASAHRESTRRRFLTEARVAAQLKTRYAVHVFDFGVTDDGEPYIVMELLEGETLGHRIKRQTCLPVPITSRFLTQAARALDRAHALGIVHRDFKPENIVIVSDEETKESIKVLDFGVAKLIHELTSNVPAEEAEAHAEALAGAGAAAALTSFTRTAGLLGTPGYMAPEQILNAPDLDLRADIWALGVVAFECLTGELPFVGNDLVELLTHIQCGMHVKARSIHPELPATFEDWFEIASATDPARRFASANIAAAELASALGESPSSTPSEAPEINPGAEPHGRADQPTLPEGPPATKPRTRAPSQFERLAKGDGFMLGGWSDMVVAVWQRSPTPAMTTHVALVLDAFAARHSEGIVEIHVLEGEGALATDDAREKIAQDMKRRESVTRAVAFVCEGEGFLAARARSVVAGIVMASRRKGAKSFATAGEAVAWLWDSGSLKAVRPEILLAVVEEVRRESQVPFSRRMLAQAVLDARDFGGLRIDASDWPVVLMEFPEQRVADSALHDGLEHIERLLDYAKETGTKIYNVNDLTRMKELAPAGQRKYAAEWTRRTISLQKAASLGGANVTPSSLLRGLITAINWFGHPPMPSIFVATRKEAYLEAVKALEAANIRLPPDLRRRLMGTFLGES